MSSDHGDVAGAPGAGGNIMPRAAARHRPVRAWRGAFAISGYGFALLSLSLTMITIIAASVLAGVVYHGWAFGRMGKLDDFAALGTLTALAYVAPLVFRNDIRPLWIGDCETGLRKAYVVWSRVFPSWNTAIAMVVAVALLTKTTADYSRGTFLLFYLFGFAGVLLVEQLAARLYSIALRRGAVTARRVMLVGTIDELAQWSKRSRGNQDDLRIVYRAQLPDVEAGDEALAVALGKHARKARRLSLDDVILLAPLSQTGRIDQCVDSFLLLPVAIHLGAGLLLDRFARVETSRIGDMTALSLTKPPMAPVQKVVKRVGDIAAAVAGSVLLLPLFVVVAVLIKLDSKGPVFFQQRRLGYNQKEFRIIKFRTMTTNDDGDEIVQATPGDNRITRVGRWLRATNIDELPQLWNVLKGEMSIVGPRPHAVAHDREFEKRIQRYPRRLNVRPGITGWAQIHGLRGETETDEKMARRVEHDLYYIDHWSIGLDAYIVLLTLFSARSYRNAR